jgi:hypothetical protein
VSSNLSQWQQQCLATGYKFVLRAVGDQGRYGVADVVTGKLVKFRADGRSRSWSSVQRAIAGVNALNGWQSYTYGATAAASRWVQAAA